MKSKLMGNYGWVQNTSNLSTIRDTIDLVPENGIKHSDLREKIKISREQANDLPASWTWDARCRIKAIHAVGLVKLERNIQGYELTDLGRRLKQSPKSTTLTRGLRTLTTQEIEIFKEGLLSNPPVIRVLDLLNEDRKGTHKGLSKYDIGRQLGFAGDVGFTHIDPFWAAKHGFSFNNKEGDADKWARTILSWLTQVGWAIEHGSQEILERTLKLYTSVPDVNNVLRYAASRIKRNVPIEMLCSGHHSFPKLVQKRRILILRALSENPATLSQLETQLSQDGVEVSDTDCKFEILNLRGTGFKITESAGYYKLEDKITLDYETFVTAEQEQPDESEQLIEDLVVKYERTIPARLVDHMIRFGYDGDKNSEFEGAVAEFFRFLGYEAEYLGQGRGRVADILAKFKHPATYAKSYAVIIDTKASSGQYVFPVGDKRKMAEYIRTHGPALLSEGIPNHAFSFISPRFTDDVKPHLKEIEDPTQIKGSALSITVLLELGDKVVKQELHIEGLYPLYSSSDLIKSEDLH